MPFNEQLRRGSLDPTSEDVQSRQYTPLRLHEILWLDEKLS